MKADNYPFGQNEKFVMLETGDMIYPRISALYTVDTYIPNLADPEDTILAKVSEFVAGDGKKGSELWNMFNVSNISSDEKMWEILTI